MIEGISAVTLGTHEMPRAVQFLPRSGFEILHGDERSSFTSFRAGVNSVTFVPQPTERRWSWWGRVIFYVADVDALYERALAAASSQLRCPGTPSGESVSFHVIDPDGHELVARPLRSSV